MKTLRQFKYTAVNPEGKRLTGVISAETEMEARNELGSLGFSILEIKAIENSEANVDAKALKDLQKYEFEGTDKTGKKVTGTIPAHDKLAAYTRLKEEYIFEINSIIDVSADRKTMAAEKLKGIEDIKIQYNEGKNKKSKKEKQPETSADQTENGESISKGVLSKSADEAIATAQSFIEKYGASISQDKLRDVQDQIGHLLRIKRSANIDLIKDSGVELIKTINKINLSLDDKSDEKKNMLFESELLLQNLKKGAKEKSGSQKNIKTQLLSIFKRISNSNVVFLKKIAVKLTGLLQTDEAIKEFQSKRLEIGNKKRELLRLWIKSSKEMKVTAWAEYKKARQGDKAVKAKMKELRKKKSSANKRINVSNHITSKYFQFFLGAMLTILLIYFFLNYYFSFKGMTMPSWIEPYLILEKSTVLRIALPITLIWYAVIALQNMNRGKHNKNILIYSSLSLISIFIAFNI